MLSGVWYALKGELLIECICKYRFIAKVHFEIRVNLNIILPLDTLFSPYSLHRIRAVILNWRTLWEGDKPQNLLGGRGDNLMFHLLIHSVNFIMPNTRNSVASETRWCLPSKSLDSLIPEKGDSDVHRTQCKITTLGWPLREGGIWCCESLAGRVHWSMGWEILWGPPVAEPSGLLKNPDSRAHPSPPQQMSTRHGARNCMFSCFSGASYKCWEERGLNSMHRMKGVTSMGSLQQRLRDGPSVKGSKCGSDTEAEGRPPKGVLSKAAVCPCGAHTRVTRESGEAGGWGRRAGGWRPISCEWFAFHGLDSTLMVGRAGVEWRAGAWRLLFLQD